MKFRLGQQFIAGIANFNSGCSFLKDELCEGRPKLIVVWKNIDAAWELILQDGHVTYHETKTFLALVVPAYIQFCMHIWSPKKFVCIGSDII